MSTLEFFLDIEPPQVTDQQKGVRIGIAKGKPVPVFYVKESVKKAHKQLEAALTPHAPEAPMDGALRLHTKWYFPMIGRSHDGQPKDTAPDTDNLQKGLKDVMEALGFFANDSRVAEEITGKYWAEKTGIWIKLEEI